MATTTALCARGRTFSHVYADKQYLPLETCPTQARGNENYVDASSTKGITSPSTPLLLGMGGITTLYIKVIVWGSRPPILGNRIVNSRIEVALTAALIVRITHAYAITKMQLDLAVMPEEGMRKAGSAPPEATEADLIVPRALRSPPTMEAARPRAIGGNSYSGSPGLRGGRAMTERTVLTARSAAPRTRRPELSELEARGNVQGIARPLIADLLSTPPTTVTALRPRCAGTTRVDDQGPLANRMKLIFKIRSYIRVKINM